MIDSLSLSLALNQPTEQDSTRTLGDNITCLVMAHTARHCQTNTAWLYNHNLSDGQAIDDVTQLLGSDPDIHPINRLLTSFLCITWVT